MTENSAKYNNKLIRVIESLQSYNVKVDENFQVVKIVDKRIPYEEYTKNVPNIEKLLSKYVKYTLLSKYKLTKYKFVHPSKESIICSTSLLESYLIDKAVIVLPDPSNPFGTFSVTDLLFGSVSKATVLSLLSITEEKGYPIIIPNYSSYKDNPEKYISNFWNQFIQNQHKNLINLIIISQSIPALYLMKIFEKYPDDLQNKVKKILFLNSKHNQFFEIFDPPTKDEFGRKATNFILSNEPSGTLLFSAVASRE